MDYAKQETEISYLVYTKMIMMMLKNAKYYQGCKMTLQKFIDELQVFAHAGYAQYQVFIGSDGKCFTAFDKLECKADKEVETLAIQVKFNY